jgi:hypothetical protein
MWILPLVGYLGSAVGFCFMTLAIGEFCLRCTSAKCGDGMRLSC